MVRDPNSKNISRIFIDSNYFIALYNRDDVLHQTASKISSQLTNQSFAISNYIFLESVTVISQRVGRVAANEAGEDLLTSPHLEIIHLNFNLHSETWKIFKEVSRKNTSFVDCSILAVMRAEGIHKLLTFDTEDFAPLRKPYHFSLF